VNKQLNWSFIARTCVAVSVAVAVVLAVVMSVVMIASAQTQGVVSEATERFEAASIKQNKDPVPGLVPRGTFEGRPGRFRASQATLQELITSAYDLFDFEILGAPSWTTSDRFDIVATMSAGEPFDDAPVRRMLRALLAERFKLVVREERREMPVYSLVLPRPDRTLGARLHPFKGECTDDPSKVALPDLTKPLPATDPSQGPRLCISGITVGRISGRGVMLSSLTTMLSRLPAVRRRVIDRTGLTGLFDYDVEWTPTVAPAGVVVPTDRPAETGPNIFSALQEQLGLKLESGKDSLRVVVVDSVNQPSPD
jgi:uncharacterized protein (TIGR03435 family)